MPAADAADDGDDEEIKRAVVQEVVVEPDERDADCHAQHRADGALVGFVVDCALIGHAAEQHKYGHRYPFAVFNVAQMGDENGAHHGNR